MILRTWFIEEIMLDGTSDAGGIGHRQTVIEFDSETGDWIRPDDRLADDGTTDGKVIWDNVMTAMEDVPTGSSKDRRWILNPVRLMDYCNFKVLGGLRPRPGTSGDGTLPLE
jgi:hypothetical protein